MQRLTTLAITTVVALAWAWSAAAPAQADDPAPVAPVGPITVECSTHRVQALRGEHHISDFATTCERVAPPPPTPTIAQRLEQQAVGPPIPGRGGPRWEGDTDYAP